MDSRLHGNQGEMALGIRLFSFILKCMGALTKAWDWHTIFRGRDSERARARMRVSSWYLGLLLGVVYRRDG